MRLRKIISIALLLLGTLGIGSVSAEEAEFAPSEVQAPVFTFPAGLYEKDLVLGIKVPDGCKVYYTMDGSVPVPEKEGTMLYEDAFSLRGEKDEEKPPSCYVFRCILVDESGRISDVATATYFVGEGVAKHYEMPLISLTTDPVNLYDPNTGIFIKRWEKGREWERPMHFAYYEDGREVVSMNVGARLHGGASRDSEVKSLRLYARKEYDTKKKFGYDFFSGAVVDAVAADGERIVEFKRLLLRNGGNESGAWERTMFRDVLVQKAAQGMGVNVQAARPVTVYLNGEYFGVLNLREREDEHYLEAHFGIEEDQSSIYEFWYDGKGAMHVEVSVENDSYYEKEKQHYKDAYAFCTTADLTIPENYEKACEYYDIEDFINYYVIQLYCGNEDWPGNNCKAWRYIGPYSEEEGKDGKIRWLLYDVEYGIGLYGQTYKRDMIAELMEATNTEWPNPCGSTALFRNFITNEEFRDGFVTRFLDVLNSHCEASLMCAYVDELTQLYAPYMEEFKKSGTNFANFFDSAKSVRNYVENRGRYVLEHLNQWFELGKSYTLSIPFETGGSVRINTITVKKDGIGYAGGQFRGVYGENYDVEITAIPDEGYEFVGWTGGVTEKSASIVIEAGTQNRDLLLIPQFEEKAEPTPIPTEVPTPTPEEPPKKEENENDLVWLWLVIFVVIGCGTGAVLCWKKKI